MASKLYGVDATIIIFVFVLYFIVLYCIVLYCIVLYCIVLYSFPREIDSIKGKIHKNLPQHQPQLLYSNKKSLGAKNSKLKTCVQLFQFVYLPVCVSSSLCIFQFVYLPVCVSSSLCIFQFLYLPVCVSSSLCITFCMIKDTF